jgi:hypothetical protein
VPVLGQVLHLRQQQIQLSFKFKQIHGLFLLYPACTQQWLP